jgi:hypothetical protein
VAKPPSSPKVLANNQPDEVVDESGPEAQMPARVWSNLKDGQNYRSRVDSTTLYLDAIASGGKISGQFAGCEFHHAAQAHPIGSACVPNSAETAKLCASFRRR